MITRRTLLKAGGCALVAYAGAPRFLLRAAHAAEASGKVLVAVFQRGAVDGLSMVMPHGDPGYAGVRPSIALQPPRRGESERAADLDGFFAFHPALAPLVPLWSNRTLAVVHACGSPATTRSHFDAQDYMETGTPGVKSTGDGWVNRYCSHDREHAPPGTPFRAVAFGPQLPRILAGSAPSLAIDDLQAFGLRVPQEGARDKLTRAFEELSEGEDTGLPASSSREGFDAIQMLKRADPSQYRPAAGVDYPQGRLGRTLLQIAQLIKADVGLEIAFADCTGWGTHVNQGLDEGPL